MPAQCAEKEICSCITQFYHVVMGFPALFFCEPESPQISRALCAEAPCLLFLEGQLRQEELFVIAGSLQTLGVPVGVSRGREGCTQGTCLHRGSALSLAALALVLAMLQLLLQQHPGTLQGTTHMPKALGRGELGHSCTRHGEGSRHPFQLLGFHLT